ncbi:sel1 repeat family protein [Burkholderia sp. Bp8963]|uniref:SEL1-like repeat protein n=1 Tax=Burkholderia sp. Bp8963 TaxID=2184547 RepID=UPI0021AB7144|nr:sel1 repeat family protein [Burkholderia sp. Bp8963]
MRIAFIFRIAISALSLIAVTVHAEGTSSLLSKANIAMSDLPRFEKLPLFDPHRKNFTCVYQSQRVPPVDPQAEMWFQQALVLDNPDVYYGQRDFAKVYQLYHQAADRGHWKAMLNLASLILTDYAGVPEHDPEKAIQWVEKAMRLGVPDAYDVMGTYHQNGLVKGGDATSAYAFFQRAADMGSPSAMAFLGEKMDAAHDDPSSGFWANLPVATQMLECAFAQGFGDAAEELGFIYARSKTVEAKQRALNILHEGVKLGSAKCANKLSIEFDGFNLTNGRNLPGLIDKARAERYGKIGDALEHYRGRLKLPNLDKVLPLPPAPLPKWNGKVQSLIDAAKAVTPPVKSQMSVTTESGRNYIPPGFAVSPLDQSTLVVPGDQHVPRTGYWLALYGADGERSARLIARSGKPERYETGERFDPAPYAWLSQDRVQWHYLGDAYRLPPQRSDFIANLVDAGMMREVPATPVALTCEGDERCPETGIWEGRVAEDNDLAALYNRWNQQTFLEKGQSFPSPGAHFIGMGEDALRWTYLGSPNAEIGPGVHEIRL